MSAIRGYTFGQLHAFGAAAERARKRDLRDAAVTARIAQAEQKHYDAYIDALGR